MTSPNIIFPFVIIGLFSATIKTPEFVESKDIPNDPSSFFCKDTVYG